MRAMAGTQGRNLKVERSRDLASWLAFLTSFLRYHSKRAQAQMPRNDTAYSRLCLPLAINNLETVSQQWPQTNLIGQLCN